MNGAYTMDQSSQRERIIQHMQDTYGTEAEYLWADTPDSAVFRHPTSKKWYAAILSVRSNKLGLPGDKIVYVINIKCSSIMIGSLLGQEGFFPAYHMNKNNWVSVLLDSSVLDDQITPLLELSYDSVSPKRKSRKQIET